MGHRRSLFALVMALVMTTPSPTRAGQAAGNPAAGDAGKQAHVLFLSIDDLTRPYMRPLFEGFTDAVSTASIPPAIFFETLDASRFQDPQYLDDHREWFRRKYRERPIDLVVPIGEVALEFLADAHGEPWPAARVLYFEADNVRVDTRSSLPLAGGLLVEDSFPDALGVMKTILPATRRVALLYGGSAIEIVRWRGLADRVREAGLEPIELVGGSMEETHRAVAQLPPNTVVVIFGPVVDTTGTVLSPLRLCEMIAAADTVARAHAGSTSPRLWLGRRSAAGLVDHGPPPRGGGSRPVRSAVDKRRVGPRCPVHDAGFR
jgi:hypothetical protein